MILAIFLQVLWAFLGFAAALLSWQHIFPKKNRHFCQLPQFFPRSFWVLLLRCFLGSACFPRENRHLCQRPQVFPSLGGVLQLHCFLGSAFFLEK